MPVSCQINYAVDSKPGNIYYPVKLLISFYTCMFSRYAWISLNTYIKQTLIRQAVTLRAQLYSTIQCKYFSCVKMHDRQALTGLGNPSFF